MRASSDRRAYVATLEARDGSGWRSCIASESSFGRVLRAHGQMRHRGRAGTPQRRRPLSTHVQLFYLYLIPDVYSRKIVGFEVTRLTAQITQWACHTGRLWHSPFFVWYRTLTMACPSTCRKVLTRCQFAGRRKKTPTDRRSGWSAASSPWSTARRHSARVHPEKARRLGTSGRALKILVDHFDLRKSQITNTALHGVLQFPTLMIISHLKGRGLTSQWHSFRQSRMSAMRSLDVDILARRHAAPESAAGQPRRWARHTRGWQPITAVTLNSERESVINAELASIKQPAPAA